MTNEPKSSGELFDAFLDARRRLIHSWLAEGRSLERIANDISCPTEQVLAISSATAPGPYGNVFMVDELVDGQRAAEEWAHAKARLDAAQAFAQRERANAQRRIEELKPEAETEFGGRPFVSERGSHLSNPHAFGPEHVEAWFHARGVMARVVPGPTPRNPGILPIKMARHACPECGHVAGEHRDGCSPLKGLVLEIAVSP